VNADDRLVPVYIVTRLSDLLGPVGLSRLLPQVLDAYDATETADVAVHLVGMLTPRDAEALLGPLLALYEVHRQAVEPDAAALADDLAVDAAVHVEPLTNQERLVLAGIATGRTNGEIGRAMYLAEATVKTHTVRLRQKLGARDRAHAVARGYELGLLPAAFHPADQAAAS